MNIGELFLNLGVRGSEKTVGALTNVKKAFSETASLSLEAKAGIVGAMYALERLFAASGRTGTELGNFNALTGTSVRTLQQYQYAARQVGVSNQEVEASFKTLQSVMTKAFLGKGSPEGLARVSLLTGGITQKDIEEYSKNPERLIQKLQQYTQKEKNIGIRNETLKSFGISEGVITALTRNAFRPDVLAKAPIYSDREVQQLDKANIAWSNLGNKIQMAVGHFNAAHGGKLVTDISKIVDQVVRLTSAFTVLAEKLHLFEGIGKIFEGWTAIFQGIASAVDQVSGAIHDPKQREKILGDAMDGGKNIAGFLTSTEPTGFLRSSLKSFTDAIVPQMGKGSVAQTKQQNNNINIHNTFQHSGVDPKKTGDSIKHAVNQAVRQLSVQTQGT